MTSGYRDTVRLVTDKRYVALIVVLNTTAFCMASAGLVIAINKHDTTGIAIGCSLLALIVYGITASVLDLRRSR
jgi:hypothetical protein